MAPRNRLSELRRAEGLTQAQLAERMGVSRSTIKRWERGAVAIPEKHRPPLADLFGCTLAHLVGYDDGDNGERRGRRCA